MGNAAGNGHYYHFPTPTVEEIACIKRAMSKVHIYSEIMLATLTAIYVVITSGVVICFDDKQCTNCSTLLVLL